MSNAITCYLLGDGERRDAIDVRDLLGIETCDELSFAGIFRGQRHRLHVFLKSFNLPGNTTTICLDVHLHVHDVIQKYVEIELLHDSSTSTFTVCSTRSVK